MEAFKELWEIAQVAGAGGCLVLLVAWKRTVNLLDDERAYTRDLVSKLQESERDNLTVLADLTAAFREIIPGHKVLHDKLFTDLEKHIRDNADRIINWFDGRMQ